MLRKRRDSMKLDQTQLFQNTKIDTSMIPIHNYPANQTIELEGNTSTYVGIILEGSVQVQTSTIQGSPIIISTLSVGMEYGDVLIFGNKRQRYPGNIVTKEATKIAVVSNHNIIHFINTNEEFRTNYLSILSNKVVTGTLHSKLLAQDTLRDKILYYLAQERIKQQSNTILLNQSKEELARFLHVKRPSLSRELANMKEEGLITYNRKTITIKK